MTAEALKVLMEAIAPVMREIAVDAMQDVCGRLVEANQARLTRFEGQLDTLSAVVGDVRERVAVVETKPAEPGPPGPPGPAGLNGKDGTPGLIYCGVYADNGVYGRGDLVTWAGSTWHCNEQIMNIKPGEGSKSWTLMVKRGRDGKDGKP